MKIKKIPFKIIVYTDVHGNIDAFKALRETDDYKSANLRVLLGDTVSMCPYPNECLETIFKSGDVFLMGNHEIYIAFGVREPEFQANELAHYDYMSNLVKPELKEKIRKLKYELNIEVDDKKLLFMHYPWETKELVCDIPNKHDLQNIAKLFSNYDFDYVFYGHEHSPSYFKDSKHYICVGSLGMKRQANYVLITITNDISIEQKFLKYDVKKVQDEMINADYPDAKFIASWLN